MKIFQPAENSIDNNQGTNNQGPEKGKKDPLQLALTAVFFISIVGLILMLVLPFFRKYHNSKWFWFAYYALLEALEGAIIFYDKKKLEKDAFICYALTFIICLGGIFLFSERSRTVVDYILGIVILLYATVMKIINRERYQVPFFVIGFLNLIQGIYIFTQLYMPGGYLTLILFPGIVCGVFAVFGIVLAIIKPDYFMSGTGVSISMNKNNSKIIGPIIMTALSFVIAWVGVYIGNYGFDVSAGEEINYIISDKKMTESQTDDTDVSYSYVFILTKDNETITLNVSNITYDEYQVGAYYPMTMYKGAFNATYYVKP